MPRLTGTATASFTVESDTPIPPAPRDNTIRLRNRSGILITDYEFQFGRPFCPGEILTAPAVMIGDQPVTVQTDVKNRYADGSVEFAVLALVIPELPPDEDVTLTILGADLATIGEPLSTAEMLDAKFDFDVVVTVLGPDDRSQSLSFAEALSAGHATAWTEGPVAQTMLIADDSEGRALDLGFGDGFRPLRLRAEATFWRATERVHVRVTGESGLTTELSDLAYRFQISAGKKPEPIYTAELTGAKRHWTMTRWTKRFWLGGTPEPQVDIDWNLGYLVATGWLPSYPADLQVAESAIASLYKSWADRPHDIYDGQWNGGLWQNAMGTTGGRQDIGPYPTWDVMAFMSGDWRMREMALGMSDLAAAWPFHLREGDPPRRLNRDDPDPGTGLGHTVALTDRRTLLTQNLTYSSTLPQDQVIFVGPRASQPWSVDGAHQPQCFFVAYLMTGDPFYLDEAYHWAGFSAGMYNPGTTIDYGRGPSGAEGVINDQVRGGGWVIRNRVETALMAPDDAPEKRYFALLARDALARWEGGFGLMGTVLDGDPCKTWGLKYGNYYSANRGPNSNKAPILGNWESNGNPAYSDSNSEIIANENNGIWRKGVVGSWTSAWMQYYTMYSVGRALELGFPAGPLLAEMARWFTGLILETGHPMLIAAYRSPVERAGGGFFDWPSLVDAHEPSWLTGEGWVPPNSSATSLPEYFAQNQYAWGRQAWALPGASYIADLPGGAEAWDWLEKKVIAGIEQSTSPFETDPTWLIRPRANARARGGVARIARVTGVG